MTSKVVLGLDLGPNSIGWALIREGKDDPGLIDLGVRVFQAGLDNFDTSKEESKNEARRTARAMRRQTKRRNRRRKALTRALIEVELWPSDSKDKEELLKLDPYVLRDAALRRKLEPHEIGRIILHLNQRRGFLSNRKTDGDKTKDTPTEKSSSEMLAEISQTEQEKQAAGHQTIGQLLNEKHKALQHQKRTENDHVRGRHLSRYQVYEEFDQIWKYQSQFHPTLLTGDRRWGASGPPPSIKDAIKPRVPERRAASERSVANDVQAFGIEGILFFQRPMYWPKSVIGLCELEPKLKRCPRADRLAERFRILQDVNNMRYVDPDTFAECKLDAQQRALFIALLERKERVTFDQIRKHLGFTNDVKFTHEKGNRKSLKGMSVECACAAAIGDAWHGLNDATKDTVVKLIRENQHDDENVLSVLTQRLGLTDDEADRAINIELPVGHYNLSRTAIKKLMPHVEAGMVYQASNDPENSAIHAAGYLRRDELQRRIFDELPDFTRVSPNDCRLGELPNPVVKRTLFELRKVVNAIIREYGKPDEVRIEMARSLKMGPKRRVEYTKRTNEIAKRRASVADKIRESNQKPTRDAILRYQLWEDQQQQCIYTGKAISLAQLHGGVVDIDHILPRSLTLDDSQANKVLCFRESNSSKGQRTPFEWLQDKQYAAVCQRAFLLFKSGRMAYSKYQRFLQKTVNQTGFIARQLNDTTYITKAAVEFLQLLFDKPSQVVGTKGQHTAELRHKWGLGTILSELPDSPAWEAGANLRAGEKNRADHRHHAIDAVVVALTSRRTLQLLSKQISTRAVANSDSQLPEPWQDFRSTISDAIRAVNVSHRVNRRVRGALHTENPYGETKKEGVFTKRTSLSSIAISQVKRIKDPVIRKLVNEALETAGIKGKGTGPKIAKALDGLTMPSGVPIKRVRLSIPDKTIAKLGSGNDAPFVKPGSNHHLCLFEYQTSKGPKRAPVFVTRLEASQRQRDGIAVIQRVHPDYPDAKFLMSLSWGEMVLAVIDGEERLLTFRFASSTTGQMTFLMHCDSGASPNPIRKSPNTLDARKVTIDPLGCVRFAGD